MKLKVGDIFEIKINDNNTAYGQIVNIPNKESITIIVFKSLYLKRPTIDIILRDNILLLGNTFDAKLYHKHWVVIDNDQSTLSELEFPYYKIGTKPVFIENFEGSRIREASKKEEESLVYRPYVAPVRFELALKAYYKSLEWKDDYDNLLYSKVIDSVIAVEHPN